MKISTPRFTTLRLLGLCLALAGSSISAKAAYSTIWSLGTQNGDPEEFGETSWETNPAPGNSGAMDDDYYFAGTYPAPINTVGANEPLGNFEKSVTSDDPMNRVHFKLNAAQATSTLRLRFVTHIVWGGWWNAPADTDGIGYGTHTLEVSMNGQLIGSQVFVNDGTMVVTANAGPGGTFTPINGANVLEIKRSAGTTGGYLGFDSLTLEINPTALVDGDSDGMPQWWEQEHGLSDSASGDAASDPDHDGSTNLQELTRKTNPNIADTDGDGLADGAETTTNPLVADTDGDGLTDGFELSQSPPLNPLVVDSDGDGSPDGWEWRTGYPATNAASKPPAFTNSIGVHFIYEVSPLTVLGPLEVTGLVPQMNWNNSRLLSGWNSPTGTIDDIASPTAGKLVNAAGSITTATIAWSSDNLYFTGNNGGPNQRLLDGYLNVISSSPASVTVSNIPYGTYDVLVYVGSVYDGAHGYVRLNNSTTTDHYFQSKSCRPESNFIEPVYPASGSQGSTAANPWSGNVIRYRNVTGTAVNVKLYRVGDDQVGIHGIQLVASAGDANSNGLPDWWELANRITPASPSDADGDGLTNAQEFTRNTNPNMPDTDGDGLSDLVETNTGTYTSANDTGSNPLLPDTDGDGLNDGVEVRWIPSQKNPNVVSPTSLQLASLPVKTTTAFTWEMTNLQIVWNHAIGHTANNQYDEDYLFNTVVRTGAYPDQDVLNMGLRMVDGKVLHFFHSDHQAAFSGPGAPADDIWDSDWGTGATDLRAGLGFSGVGTVDISDRLRFRTTASKNANGTWNLAFEIYNLDTATVVKSRSFNSTTLSPSLNIGTVWQDDEGNLNALGLRKHAGMEFYQQAATLESTTAFSASLDTDEDGIPDAWEIANSFNKNSAADATVDTDNDGLSNLKEFLNGTNPRNADTDGDGASDGVEVSSGSNPLQSTSKPPYFTGPPAGTSGEDFNGNGIPDAWELRFNAFGLSPSADADGDGQTNLREAIAGTNPFDAASVLQSRSLGQGNDFLLCWPPLQNKQQRAWDSSTLGNWALSPGSPTLVSGEYRHSYPNSFGSAAKRFFKVEVNDMDSDNDGVSDWTENLVLHSNPANANSLASAAYRDGATALSGDYAALLARFQGARGDGGFVGGTNPAGTSISRSQAARFLTQATFGPTPDDIEHLQSLGYNNWITEQIGFAATLHSTYAKAVSIDFHGPRGRKDYNANKVDDFIYGNNLQTAFARAAIQGQDQLRQRVAFALSQILVASRRDANLENQLVGMADFYDIFIRNAFGNYHQILREVALHPCMGRYLSHVGNQKANPAINQYPDENFAREVMQLFSIGLWELNPDGTRQVNGLGQNIPTYGNTEITQMARVFTGLWFSGHEWGVGGWFDADYATPMSMHAMRHDFGQKTLLHGFVIPPRAATATDAMRDIDDAIRHLFEHSNTGPFICKQLIQFLVTDNPTPAYVQRVTGMFANNGAGVRGDMKAVVKAILLDDEARSLAFSESVPSHGRLKEPVMRTMALARAFGLQQATDLLWWDWGEFFDNTHQAPAYSPSVFNFYRPEYRAPGLLTANNLVGPVFQITDSYSCISFPNQLWNTIELGLNLYDNYQFPLNLARESALAATPERLMDHLNTLICAGSMSLNTRTTILNSINLIPANLADARARVAIYLTLVCPEGAIMK